LIEATAPGPARDQMVRKLTEFGDELEKFPSVAADGDHSSRAASKRTIEEALRPALEALAVLELMIKVNAGAET